MSPEDYVREKLVSNREDLKRLSSAKELYENPFRPEDDLYDNIFLTGKPTVYADGSVNIEIDDTCPVLASPKLTELIRSLELEVNIVSFDEIMDSTKHCRFSNGSFLSTDRGNGREVVMQQRGVFIHDDPEKGPVSTPAALNQLIGNSDGPIRKGMDDERQSEVLIIVQKSDGSGSFHPVRLTTEGCAGDIDYTARTVQKVREFLQDPDSEINTRTIPNPDSLLNNMGKIMDVELTHVEDVVNERYIRYSISVDGELQEENHGIPHFNTSGNTFEFNQSLEFQVPEGYSITHVIGCEPYPGRMAAMFRDEDLKGMSLAPRRVPDEQHPILEESLGKDASGLTRSPTAFFCGVTCDYEYDPEMEAPRNNALGNAYVNAQNNYTVKQGSDTMPQNNF